jgi:hypothetical protein
MSAINNLSDKMTRVLKFYCKSMIKLYPNMNHNFVILLTAKYMHFHFPHKCDSCCKTKHNKDSRYVSDVPCSNKTKKT